MNFNMQMLVTAQFSHCLLQGLLNVWVCKESLQGDFSIIVLKLRGVSSPLFTTRLNLRVVLHSCHCDTHQCLC